MTVDITYDFCITLKHWFTCVCIFILYSYFIHIYMYVCTVFCA